MKHVIKYALSILVSIGAALMMILPALAWTTIQSWSVTDGKQNQFAPYSGRLTGMCYGCSPTDRWHYAGQEYFAWNATAINWILANRGIFNALQTSLVFHTFRPNSQDSCNFTVDTNTVWTYGNLPIQGAFTKATCGTQPLNEVRIRVGDPTSLSPGTNYWVQAIYHDYGSFDNGEITADSYWEDTAIGPRKIDNEYLNKFCYRSYGDDYSPSGGLC